MHANKCKRFTTEIPYHLYLLSIYMGIHVFIFVSKIISTGAAAATDANMHLYTTLLP